MKKFKLKHMEFIPILLVAFLLFKLVMTTDISIANVFGVVRSCVSYFVYGFIVAYFLNPLVSFFERKILKEDDKSSRKKVMRGIIVAAVYLMVLGIVVVFFVTIIPAIIDAVTDFVNNFPQYLANLQNWANKTFAFLSPEAIEKINVTLSHVANYFANWAAESFNVSKVGGVLTNAVSVSAKFVINFVFTIVISIYFLYGKEHLLKSIKQLVYALFSIEKVNSIFACSKKINKIFYDFILSKIVQAFVLFLFGLVILMPLGIHFAPLISLVLAVSNMIPYIGPWIGSVPCLLLLLLYSPIQAAILLIFILGMQILDNVFIGPKITSDRVGISPLLVIAGVAIGGTFGGVIGMFIGVPAVAVVKLVIYDGFIEKRLKEKNIDI